MKGGLFIAAAIVAMMIVNNQIVSLVILSVLGIAGLMALMTAHERSE